MNSLKIYLAGPDVFYPDAVQHGKNLSEIVRSHGHEPLFPLDNTFPPETPELSKKIFDANVQMIRACDIVMANLNAFRGFEPDSGTVWEIGFAAALGKKTIGYLENTDPLVAKITGGKTHFSDTNGMIIENFGHPLNLMLMHGLDAVVQGDLASALNYLKESDF